MEVAIDDFGSGYSNEVRVLKLAPDIVKIDMSLIQSISHDQNKQMIVSSIVDFCKKNGSK